MEKLESLPTTARNFLYTLQKYVLILVHIQFHYALLLNLHFIGKIVYLQFCYILTTLLYLI